MPDDADQNTFAVAYRKAVRDSGLSTEGYRDVIAAGIAQNATQSMFQDQAPKTADQVRFRVIVLTTEDDAKAALDRLQKGEDFATVASQVSQDTASRDKGGEQDWTPRGILDPPLDQALFSLEVGQISDIITGQNALFIVQVLEKQAQRDTTDSQRAVLANQAQQAWLSQLADSVGVATSLSDAQRNTSSKCCRPKLTRGSSMVGDRSQVGVGLMGLGVVGSGVARALLERGEAYGRQLGCPLRLVRILEREPDRERPVRVDRALFTQDVRDIIDNPGIDVVIEVLGGEHPAYEYQQRALAAGKYVVTANKEVIAKHGAELRALAQEHGVDILYEASVGGGIPIIAPLKHDLLANEITAITPSSTAPPTTSSPAWPGGERLRPALRRAQELGYAEANPTNDIEGIDAAYKLAILATLAFHTDVHPEDVYREGITRLSARDFRYARELGYAIKLLAMARKHDSRLQVRVHPALFMRTSSWPRSMASSTPSRWRATWWAGCSSRGRAPARCPPPAPSSPTS